MTEKNKMIIFIALPFIYGFLSNTFMLIIPPLLSQLVLRFFGSGSELALISQYYMLAFIWSGTKLSLLFTDVIHGTTITIISYLSMLLAFTVGFIIHMLISSKRDVDAHIKKLQGE